MAIEKNVLKKQDKLSETIKEFKFFLWKIVVLAAHGVNGFPLDHR